MISFIVMIVWWIGKFWEQLISQINLCLGCLERTFTSFLTQDKLVRRVKAILETSPPIKTTIIRSDDQSSWLMIRLRLKSMSTLVAAASSYTLFTLAIVSVIDGDIFRRSEQWWCHFLLSLYLNHKRTRGIETWLKDIEINARELVFKPWYGWWSAWEDPLIRWTRRENKLERMMKRCLIWWVVFVLDLKYLFCSVTRFSSCGLPRHLRAF